MNRTIVLSGAIIASLVFSISFTTHSSIPPKKSNQLTAIVDIAPSEGDNLNDVALSSPDGQCLYFGDTRISWKYADTFQDKLIAWTIGRDGLVPFWDTTITSRYCFDKNTAHGTYENISLGVVNNAPLKAGHTVTLE